MELKQAFGLIFYSFFSIVLIAQIQPDPLPVKVVIDEYHGQKVEDPYRYMENLENPVVLKWIKDHATYSENVLNSIPGKQKLVDTFKDLLNRTSSEITKLRITDNNNYYYLKRQPGEQFASFYIRNGYEGEEKLMFDPTEYKKETGVQKRKEGRYGKYNPLRQVLATQEG